MSQRIYVTRRIPQPGLDLLDEAGFAVEVNPDDRSLTREELLNAVRDRDGLLPMLTDRIDAILFDAGPDLKIVANYAVGYNNIDIPEATQRGIAVTNTPGVLTDATADTAWALLMAVARRVVDSDRYTREGKFVGWAPMLYLGADVTERTLGIVGGGRIGRAMAERAQGFRMKVVYADPIRNPELEEACGAEHRSLEALLGESDFVSLHCALVPETQHLIGAAELSLMQPHAILINTARGPVVDEAALCAALKEKRIGGAGLDVYEEEPKLYPGLVDLDNAVLLPHIASASIETRSNMALIAARNIVARFKGDKMPTLLNPEVLA